MTIHTPSEAPPGFVHPWLCVIDRLAVMEFGIVVGSVLGGWSPAEAVHQSAGVVPADPVGGESLEVAEAGQWSAAEG